MTALWLALGVGSGIAAIGARVRFGQDGDEREGGVRVPIPLLPATVCATILGLTFLTAVVAPPNYPDSMTYHMSRVAHWIQARSVDWYPTGDPRQNYQMPFAEFVILHLQLLSGGDRWANLVQWASFALCGVTVSLILGELGVSTRVQWTGAIVAFTIPMAILQASGAQNDLVVSLWLLVFLLFLWRTLADRSWESAALCGLALGLALASKGTAYLYAPALGAAILVARVATAPAGRRLPPIRPLILTLALAASMSLGIWARSVAERGTPICCGNTYFVARLTPGDAVSNVLRNTATHLGIPKLRQEVRSAVDFFSPVDIDHPATTWKGARFTAFFSFHEGKAGNTLFLIAFLICATAIAADRRLRRGPAPLWMAAAIAGFLAYSLALRWQPWASRLQLPAFLVATVPVAIAIGVRDRRFQGIALALFVAAAIPFLLFNQSRPLVPRWGRSILAVPRDVQYYADRRAWRLPYTAAAAYVRASGEPEIGILFAPPDYEYPFWLDVKKDLAGPPLIRHVGVPRAGGEPSPPPPAMVITSRAGERHDIDGYEYVRVRDFGALSALRRGRNAEAAGATSHPQRPPDAQ